MNLVEIYFLLFVDTLVSNLAINTSSELAIYSMKVFNLYNNYIVISVAMAGYIIACFFNYLLGMMCHGILAPFAREEAELSAKRIQQFRELKYIFLLFMFGAVPFFGKFIVVLAGFCRINWKLTITSMILVRIVYYCYLFVV